MTDYTKLIQRLRRHGEDSVGYYGMPIANDAANAIEALQAERDQWKNDALNGGNAAYLREELNKRTEERDALQAKLTALEKQEPVMHQFQTVDGGWHPFLDDAHYLNTMKDGRWPIRALYAAPKAQGEVVAWVSVAKGDVSKALLYFNKDEQIQPLGVIGEATTYEKLREIGVSK